METGQVFARSEGITYDFYVYDQVGAPSEYVDLIHTLRTAQPTDIIYLHFNTPGGRLDSTISIVDALADTQATVIGSAEGDVASAGTVLFLACHQYKVSPHAQFMFHDGSGGAIGKFNEMAKQSVAAQRQLEALYREVYIPFMSEDEVTDILRGCDVWMEADEVLDRLYKMADIVNEQAQAANTVTIEQVVQMMNEQGITVDGYSLDEAGQLVQSLDLQSIIDEVAAEEEDFGWADDDTTFDDLTEEEQLAVVTFISARRAEEEKLRQMEDEAINDDVFESDSLAPDNRDH